MKPTFNMQGDMLSSVTPRIQTGSPFLNKTIKEIKLKSTPFFFFFFRWKRESFQECDSADGNNVPTPDHRI